MIESVATEIPDCRLLKLRRAEDERGTFGKIFQRSAFTGLGLEAEYVELFYSRSNRGVVRGLHFQEPPRALHKIVTCVHGEAWDVVVDLRLGSPAYGRHVAVGLSEASGLAVAVPVGCAHGFLAVTDDTTLVYLATDEHSPEHDSGVHWDSADILWPLDAEPVVSPRDAALPSLAAFSSPFRYGR